MKPTLTISLTILLAACTPAGINAVVAGSSGIFNPLPAKTATADVPPAGTQVDAKFWRTFMKPAAKKGLKLTYLASHSIYSVQDILDGTRPVDYSEQTFEITDVSGDDVTLSASPAINRQENPSEYSTSFNFAESKLLLFKYSLTAKEAPSDLDRYKSGGEDDVTVEAGKFEGIARVTYEDSSGDKYTQWYAAGIGLLKSKRAESGGSSKGVYTSETMELTALSGN